MQLTKIAIALLCTVMVQPAQAGTVNKSPRPQSRTAATPEPAIATFSTRRSVRPLARPSLTATATTPQPASANASSAGFQQWIGGFKRKAMAQGISANVLDTAFRGVQYDKDVIKRDRNQSEFTKTIWDYLDSAASDTRIKNGKSALHDRQSELDAIEAKYGVDKEVVAAVWGLESAYGSYRGDNNVVQSLATLAYDGRRGKFFEAQLLAAFEILQNGDTTAGNMTGSWAGAMGHTQFIPTSYLAYAVDFDGDGRRDIWADDPSDALASTAAYLAHSGWVKGQPWGVEVKLPKGFDYALASRKIHKSPGDWAKLGIVDMEGSKVPNYGSATILLPAGGQGAAFMIFKNFSVIERYNTADAYVIGVGHLSDRIKGGPSIKANWPREDRALTLIERREMQTRLTKSGFSTQGVDGKIGPKTIEAVRAYQRSVGMAPDGYASLMLLKRLR